MPLPPKALEDFMAIKGDMLRCIVDNSIDMYLGSHSLYWLQKYDADALNVHGRLVEPYRFNRGARTTSETLHHRFVRMVELLEASGYSPLTQGGNVDPPQSNDGS